MVWASSQKAGAWNPRKVRPPLAAPGLGCAIVGGRTIDEEWDAIGILPVWIQSEATTVTGLGPGISP